MSHKEAVLEDIKAELNYFDYAALQSIRKIINQTKRLLANAPKTGRRPALPLIDIESIKADDLSFTGENLTPEEYGRLTLPERSKLQERLQALNHFWLKETFTKREAAWLVVVDGQVIASGKTLRNLPMRPQIRRLCRRTGKFPFIFVNEELITIEETTAAWFATNQAWDYYPTFPLICGQMAAGRNALKFRRDTAFDGASLLCF